MKYFNKCDINEHIDWINENYPMLREGELSELYDKVIYSNKATSRFNNIKKISDILSRDHNYIMDVVTGRRKDTWIKELIHELIYIHYIDYSVITRNISAVFGRLDLLKDTYFTLDKTADNFTIISVSDKLYTFSFTKDSVKVAEYIFESDETIEVMIPTEVLLMLNVIRYLNSNKRSILDYLLNSYCCNNILSYQYILSYVNMLSNRSNVTYSAVLSTELELYKEIRITLNNQYDDYAEKLEDTWYYYSNSNIRHNPWSRISNIFNKYSKATDIIRKMRELKESDVISEELTELTNEGIEAGYPNIFKHKGK